MQKNMQLPGLHTSQLRLWRRWALFGQWWWHLQLLLFRCSTWIAAMPGEMFSSFLDLRTSRWVNATSHLEIFKRETGNFTLILTKSEPYSPRFILQYWPGHHFEILPWGYHQSQGSLVLLGTGPVSAVPSSRAGHLSDPSETCGERVQLWRSLCNLWSVWCACLCVCLFGMLGSLYRIQQLPFWGIFISFFARFWMFSPSSSQAWTIHFSSYMMLHAN